MMYNTSFFNSIKPALIKLRSIFGDDFVVFGSTPLYLLNVLSAKTGFNDLDIAIKDSVRIPPDAKKVTFQGNPEQKFYKLTIGNLNIDIGLAWPGQEAIFDKLFLNPIEIEGFKFVNLETITEWKLMMVEKYGREKDERHLERIKEFNTNQKTKKEH